MSVTCSGCNAVLDAGASFCPECGRPVSTGASVDQAVGLPADHASRPRAGGLSLTFSQWLLVGASLLLLVALLLPWWSLTAVLLGTLSIDGFHSWGWLSFVSWLAVITLTFRLVAGDRTVGTPLRALTVPVAQRLIVAAGAAELLGNFFFIAAAPTGSGPGYSAGIGAGVVIAIICGLAIVYGGLLMIGPSWLPKPKPAR